MNTGFGSQCVPNYRILTEGQIIEIHKATLQLLEDTGVRIMHPQGIQLLKDAGCRINGHGNIQIPSGLVESCIHSAPASITIYSRNAAEAMQLEENKVHFGLGTDLLKTYDLETGILRPSRLQDVVNAARIADYFEDIDFIASYAHPQDIPANLAYIESFRAELENSIKPIFFTAAGSEDLAIIIEMAAAVAGGKDQLRRKPFIIHYSEPTSPLTHSSSALQKLFLCAAKGVPITYTPGMLSGASGPVTLAGAITVANAEALSGVVLHQLTAKGAPIISGFGISTMDMLTGAPIYACPEYRLALSACADLYHYYEIPMWGTAGVSDANCLDQQAGMEAAVSLLMAGLDGANLVHDVGYLGQGLIGSPAAIVMGAEIISYVKKIIHGFDIGADRIGMDVIRQVGPGGDFLSAAQTLKLHQQEHWRPMFANRASLNQWQDKGQKTYGEIVTRKAIEILKSHACESLPEDVRQSIATIGKNAKTAFLNKNFDV